jgi:glycerol kinase
VRAALESLAYQTADLIGAFEDDSQAAITSLKVDGGVAANGFLMQFMADLLGVPVEKPVSPEATGHGAAFLAGLTAGLWLDKAELNALEIPSEAYMPRPCEREGLMAAWHQALRMVLRPTGDRLA